MTIYGLNMDGLGTDTREAKIRRATFGGLYGFLSGTAFVFMAAYIDILLNPDLPFGVDWSALMTRLLLIALGLALVGAVTCWWHEAWQGLVSGAAVAATLALIVALVSAEVTTGLKFIVLVFTLVPIAAMTLPVAYILRWVTERHAAVLQLKWSSLRVAWLMILMLALGAGSGYFMKTSSAGLAAVQLVHDLLQNPAQPKNPLAKIEAVQTRQNLTYKLFESRSAFSTEGYDIHIEYEDGYKLRCVVVAYPGTNPFVSGCTVEQ